MVCLTSLSAVALLIASGVIAAPWHSNTHHHTHRARGVGPAGVKLISYHPPSLFETYGVDGAGFSAVGRNSSEDLAKSFLQERLGVTADGLVRHAGHTHDDVDYEYFAQTINGLRVSNAVANVAVKDGKVVSYGASFIKPKNVSPKEPSLDQTRAIALAEEATDGKWNQWPIKLEYTARDDQSCTLTYVVQIQRSDGTWKEFYVDGHDGTIVNVVDFVADSSYHVVPFNYQDPTQQYRLVESPEDPSASPQGWHTSTTTSGNNAIVYQGVPLLGTTRQSSSNNTYEYPHDASKEPNVPPNVDAARVNAFYSVNKMHDVTYLYGFTESAYNFQNSNFGKGGNENDGIQVSVQDGSGKNNANFATPPDGQPGIMRMYTWDFTTPNRDGALENDIVTHEYAHGVSNRITGGGTGRCLQTTEAGGMGEGWSDAMADITEAKTVPLPDFTLGSYVTNKPGGIRTYPYSTNMVTNPLTYKDLDSRNEVHAIGEVWALIWHELLALFGKQYGIGDSLDPSKETGNSIVLHLMMDGFSLQSCNPTFIIARDGAEAGKYMDNYDVPEGC
ncbi:unnamed protein product [Rhizoctonia solani]|uniref:Extracellular metalloproteinase n=1 Tax=Rhizoctonia solani TaxID=456999 RepID=A0A8H2XU11_9AGAM|nr:unnamed protein product [Rhizoctonia solani]